jgi:GNAT superfamily N-acetyltransferase
MNLKIIRVDYSHSQQAHDLVWLLTEYAKTPEAGNTELTTFTKENIVKELAKIGAFSLIAYVDDQPAGLVNVYTLFSTFKCQPVFNLQDIFVIEKYRRQGLCKLLLQTVEKIAIEIGVCRLTLDVFEHNENAKKAYAKFGFVGCQLNPLYGNSLFLEKNFSEKS